MNQLLTDDETLSFYRIDNENVFTKLVIGLKIYLEQPTKSTSMFLREAMNTLALTMASDFPKTLNAFLILCHQPLGSWYPYELPRTVSSAASVLDEGRISEEVDLFFYDMLTRLRISEDVINSLPASALDGRLMSDFLTELYGQEDQERAQTDYVAVRSFLITHSWCSTRDLRRLDVDHSLQETIHTFYEEAPFTEGQEFYVCDYCGILHPDRAHWRGLKPRDCDDHRTAVPHVKAYRAPRNMRRLKAEIHRRIFIPGQAELRLFEWAEDLYSQFPTVVSQPIRYPSLDAYDLHLTLSNGEGWAIDMKDHRLPQSLATQIHPLQGDYTHGVYVVPDRRLQDNPAYMRDLSRFITTWPSHHEIKSETEFYRTIERKIQHLLTPNTSKRKGKA